MALSGESGGRRAPSGVRSGDFRATESGLLV
jgi:hypothetical protein